MNTRDIRTCSIAIEEIALEQVYSSRGEEEEGKKKSNKRVGEGDTTRQEGTYLSSKIYVRTYG